MTQEFGRQDDALSQPEIPAESTQQLLERAKWGDRHALDVLFTFAPAYAGLADAWAWCGQPRVP
jgi:hypothetical protein